MMRQMLKSKIHRATVTQSDLEYEGSIAIDETLMKAADILPHEKVSVWNITNGQRFETYALKAEKGSGVICINGAAARLAAPDDRVIIASWLDMESEQAEKWKPRLVFVNDDNTIKSTIPGLAASA